MFAINSFFSSCFKKIAGRGAVFGWEITLAVLVKFLLLGGLWWLFFAGNKQPVNEAIIADKIFGANNPAIISK
jgi:hypothetical protein